MYLLSFRILEQLALGLKTEFALKFFKPGGAGDPRPPPRTLMTTMTRIRNRPLLRYVEYEGYPCVPRQDPRPQNNITHPFTFQVYRFFYRFLPIFFKPKYTMVRNL